MLQCLLTHAFDLFLHRYTWGNGWSGTLGHRDERIRTVPEMVVITDHGSDSFRFSKCAAGFGHTVLYAFNAQQKMYTLFTFGLNDCGQLGLGDVVNRNRPCSVVIRDQKLTDGVVVSCGYRHTVVQCEASQSEVGAIFCFGSNQHQLFGSLFSESYYTHPMQVLPPYHSPTSNLTTKFVVAGKCCNVYVSADNRMSIVGYIAGPGKTDEDNEPTSGLFSILLQNVHPQAKDINIKGLSVGDEHCIVLCEDNDYERVVPGLMQKLKEAESARTKTTGARTHPPLLPSRLLPSRLLPSRCPRRLWGRQRSTRRRERCIKPSVIFDGSAHVRSAGRRHEPV